MQMAMVKKDSVIELYLVNIISGNNAYIIDTLYMHYFFALNYFLSYFAYFDIIILSVK